MNLISGFKSLLSSGKVDIDSRFELLRAAVSGSMSQFYKARDRKSGEVVGLKILDVEKTTHFESRFKGLNKPHEGEIAAALNHPRIVKTLEHGITTKGQRYIVMEFLQGKGLNSLIIGRDKILEGQRLSLIRQAGEALQAVHEAGYIHRDFCPRNLVASHDAESLTLIDFGLSVPARAEYMQPGNRTGTPNYMAPEIVRRRPTDLRVDVFAFGVTAYAICTYELPWQGGTTGKAAMNHDAVLPKDIYTYRPQLNRTLGDAIMGCLERKASNRPSSITNFLQLIEKVQQDDEATE